MFSLFVTTNDQNTESLQTNNGCLPPKHPGDTPGDYRELGYSGTEGVGVAGNGSLVISRVSRDHAGFYLCQASNGIGPGLSKLIRLTVHGKIFTQHRVTVAWICVSPRELGIPATTSRPEILRFVAEFQPNQPAIPILDPYRGNVSRGRCSYGLLSLKTARSASNTVSRINPCGFKQFIC